MRDLSDVFPDSDFTNEDDLMLVLFHLECWMEEVIELDAINIRAVELKKLNGEKK